MLHLFLFFFCSLFNGAISLVMTKYSVEWRVVSKLWFGKDFVRTLFRTTFTAQSKNLGVKFATVVTKALYRALLSDFKPHYAFVIFFFMNTFNSLVSVVAKLRAGQLWFDPRQGKSFFATFSRTILTTHPERIWILSTGLTLWSRNSSKWYLRIQSVPQREHHTSPLQRSTG
jgi:hypothetical protein